MQPHLQGCETSGPEPRRGLSEGPVWPPGCSAESENWRGQPRSDTELSDQQTPTGLLHPHPEPPPLHHTTVRDCREEVKHMTGWGSHNNLLFDTTKTKEASICHPDTRPHPLHPAYTLLHVFELISNLILFLMCWCQLHHRGVERHIRSNSQRPQICLNHKDVESSVLKTVWDFVPVKILRVSKRPVLAKDTFRLIIESTSLQ